MSGPDRIRLKRKATEAPPGTLLLKRSVSEQAGQEIRYQWQKPDDVRYAERHVPGRRTFHLTRKRKAGDEHADGNEVVGRRRALQAREKRDVETREVDQPFKRPGKGSATNRTVHVRPESTQEKRRIEDLAEELHQFALAELAVKPKVTAVPNLSAARSREIHRQRTAAPPNPIEAEGDYVYDTYILAPKVEDAETSDDVAYLVITEDDWEMYEEQEDDEEETDDEEDENAEDYYGADYPEDELASDDEFDRDAYRFRAGEEWDDDAGVDSGDDEEAPWKAKSNHALTIGAGV